MSRIKCWILSFVVVFLLSVFSFPLRVRAQAQEIEQLLLNVEKLTQLKGILSDMKKGYEILTTGYNSVKNIAQGNFSLHQVFLDGLWLVSPEVRKYYKVPEIIADQNELLSACRSAYQRCSSGGVFSTGELAYLNQVFAQLKTASLKNLDELSLVLTDSRLRMSDAERLQAVDRIHAAARDRLVFLRAFVRESSILQAQRRHELADQQTLRRYYQNP